MEKKRARSDSSSASVDAPADSALVKKLRYPFSEGPSFTSQPITVVVGGEKRNFYLHEKHIRMSSKYFDKALDESGGSEVVLPTVCPEAFEIYTKWLYSGRLYIMQEDDTHSAKDSVMIESSRYRNCYALAALVEDTDFKDAIIDTRVEMMRNTNYHSRSMVQWIYANSCENSVHRKFAVEYALVFWKAQGFEQSRLKDFPDDFKIDLIAAMGAYIRKGVKNDDPMEDFFEDSDTCTYHEHGESGVCYKKKQRFLF